MTISNAWNRWACSGGGALRHHVPGHSRVRARAYQSWQDELSRRGLLAGVAAGAIALSGCGSGTPAGPGDGHPATRTLIDPTGRSLTMPVEPKAALGFYTTDVDILITLGFPLAKLQPIRGDSGYTEFPSFFPKAELQGVTTFANFPEHNYEKILEAEPDFILNGIGYDAKALDKLPEIAPTYSVNAYDGQDWRVHFKATAEALGRSEQLRAWQQHYQATVAGAKSALESSRARDWAIGAVRFREGNLLLGYGIPSYTLADDLGLRTHPLMQQKDASLAPEQYGQLASLDAILLPIGVGEQGRKNHEELLETLNRIPTWRELPSVQKKRIYTYEMEMIFGSPSGQVAFVETVRDTLVQGAQQ